MASLAKVPSWFIVRGDLGITFYIFLRHVPKQTLSPPRTPYRFWFPYLTRINNRSGISVNRLPRHYRLIGAIFETSLYRCTIDDGAYSSDHLDLMNVSGVVVSSSPITEAPDEFRLRQTNPPEWKEGIIFEPGALD
jgi:hypothetical protein